MKVPRKNNYYRNKVLVIVLNKRKTQLIVICNTFLDISWYLICVMDLIYYSETPLWKAVSQVIQKLYSDCSCITNLWRIQWASRIRKEFILLFSFILQWSITAFSAISVNALNINFQMFLNSTDDANVLMVLLFCIFDGKTVIETFKY